MNYNIEDLRRLPIYKMELSDSKTVLCFSVSDLEDAFESIFYVNKINEILSHSFDSFSEENVFIKDNIVYISEKFVLLYITVLLNDVALDNNSKFFIETFVFLRYILLLFCLKTEEQCVNLSFCSPLIKGNGNTTYVRKYDDEYLEKNKKLMIICHLNFALSYFCLNNNSSFRDLLITKGFLHLRGKFFCHKDYGIGAGANIYLNNVGVHELLDNIKSFRELNQSPRKRVESILGKVSFSHKNHLL